MSEDAITPSPAPPPNTTAPASLPSPAFAHPFIRSSSHHRLPLMTLAGSNLCLSKANNAVNGVHDDNSFRGAQCALPTELLSSHYLSLSLSLLSPSAQPSSQTLN